MIYGASYRGTGPRGLELSGLEGGWPGLCKQPQESFEKRAQTVVFTGFSYNASVAIGNGGNGGNKWFKGGMCET